MLAGDALPLLGELFVPLRIILHSEQLGIVADGDLGLLHVGQLGQLLRLLDRLLEGQPRDGFHLGPELVDCDHKSVTDSGIRSSPSRRTQCPAS